MTNINITAGEILNSILSKDEGIWIPFNEAMNKGNYSNSLFSHAFFIERSKTHEVSLDEYLTKIKPFLNFLNNLEKYNQVTLWFGDDPFCVANYQTIIDELISKNYQGTIILNIVDENTGIIIKNKIIEKGLI